MSDESMPVGLPRFVILGADFANGVVDLLEGLDDLLRMGDLTSGQLLLVTKGRRIPGQEVSQRLACLVGEIAWAIRDQLD